MKRQVPYGAALSLALLMIVGGTEVRAQNRSTSTFPQQNQQSALGTGSQGTFGNTGQSALGQSVLGQGQQGATGGFGQAGNQGTNARRPPAGGQDGFVGTDAQQIRNQQNNGNQRQRRRAMFDFAVESLNEMRESRRRYRANRNKKPPVRVQLRPLFAVQQPSASELTTRVRTQLGKALPSTLAAAQISVSGSIATIEGRAKSEYDKQLAAKMLSLQPGISQVENRLTIEPGQVEPLLFPAR